jgi:homoserine O-acetyltransferase
MSPLAAQEFPKPTEGNYVTHEFHFRSGEVLPELRLHYRTLGKPVRDANGHVTNAVMFVHPTTADGEWYLTSQRFAGELLGPGQLLDATRYYIIAPDAIGHGKSRKPSDGLHARFPHYDYEDMVEAEHLFDRSFESGSLAAVYGHVDGLHARFRIRREVPGSDTGAK